VKQITTEFSLTSFISNKKWNFRKGKDDEWLYGVLGDAQSMTKTYCCVFFFTQCCSVNKKHKISVYNIHK